MEKTAAFTIGALQRIDYSFRECQALILTPTRELAKQIQKFVLALGDELKIKCHACISGTSVRTDMSRPRNRQHCIVGTPEDVLDMLSTRQLRAENLHMCVLDGADAMLSRGFQDQIYDIFSFVPADMQVCVFTAVMTSPVHELISDITHDDAVHVYVPSL